MLPHSFSRQALQEAQHTTAFSALLTDYNLDAPTDIEVINPKMLHVENEAIASFRHLDEPFLILFTEVQQESLRYGQRLPEIYLQKHCTFPKHLA